MKKFTTIIFLLTLFLMNVHAQDSTSKKLNLGFYGGIKLPEDDISMSSGPWFGLFINLPIGLGWSLQLEYNFWGANDDGRGTDEEVFVSEFPFLIAYKWDISNIYLQILAGPGIVSSGSTIFGGDRDFLLSFDAALKVGLSITKDANGFLQVRKQWAGSMKEGRGSAYCPWLIGIGIQYRLSKQTTIVENKFYT